MNRRVVLVVLFVLAVALPVHALTYTWTWAASNKWSNQNNWKAVGVPGTGDSVAFGAGPTVKNGENDLPAGTSLNVIALNTSGYTLPGNSVTLTGGIADVSSNPINFPLSLGAAAAQFSGNYRVNGAITGTGTIDTAGNVYGRLSGTHTYSGTLRIVNGSLILNNANLASASVTQSSTRWLAAGGSGL